MWPTNAGLLVPPVRIGLLDNELTSERECVQKSLVPLVSSSFPRIIYAVCTNVGGCTLVSKLVWCAGCWVVCMYIVYIGLTHYRTRSTLTRYDIYIYRFTIIYGVGRITVCLVLICCYNNNNNGTRSVETKNRVMTMKGRATTMQFLVFSNTHPIERAKRAIV